MHTRFDNFVKEQLQEGEIEDLDEELDRYGLPTHKVLQYSVTEGHDTEAIRLHNALEQSHQMYNDFQKIYAQWKDKIRPLATEYSQSIADQLNAWLNGKGLRKIDFVPTWGNVPHVYRVGDQGFNSLSGWTRPAEPVAAVRPWGIGLWWRMDDVIMWMYIGPAEDNEINGADDEDNIYDQVVYGYDKAANIRAWREDNWWESAGRQETYYTRSWSDAFIELVRDFNGEQDGNSIGGIPMWDWLQMSDRDKGTARNTLTQF